MSKQKPRTYKTISGAIRYARKLMNQYPGRTFSVLPDPSKRHGVHSFVVGYLIDRDGVDVQWALMS